MKRILNGWFLAAVAAGFVLQVQAEGPVFGKAELFDATGRDAMALAREGHYLYGGSGDWVVVFDIADPLHPKKVGTVRGVGAARQLVAQNGMLYVTSREYGLWIVDATDPVHPRIRSRFDTCELATGVDVAGNVCFCGQRQNGVEFIDVSDPDHPRHIAMRKTDESQSVLYRDGWLYSGEWGAGHVTVFDARDMKSIRQVALVDLYGYGDGLWAQGHYLFASRGHHSLHRKVTGGVAVDANERRKSSAPRQGLGMGHGVDVFDIADPAHPQRVGAVDFPPMYVRGLDMWTSRTSGDLLVAAQTHNGLIAVDISDKAHPNVLERWLSPPAKPAGDGTVRPSDCVGSVAIGDGVVYAAVRGRGFFLLPCVRARAEAFAKGVLPVNADFREPYPTDAKTWHVWKPHDVGQVHNVALKGNVAYVACGDAGLYVLDIKPGAAGWRERGKVQGREQVYDVSICGDRLYTAEGGKGFGVYDISGVWPKEIARLERLDATHTLAYWVIAIDTTRVFLSDRRRWALYDVSNLPKFTHVMNCSVRCPGWDKYMMDRPVGGRYMAFNNAHHSVTWFDVEAGRVANDTSVNFTSLSCGLGSVGSDLALMTRGRGYSVLHPNEGDAADGSEWPLVKLPPSSDPRLRKLSPGIPRSDGRLVAFTSRIARHAMLYDLADPQHPVEKGIWPLSGNPDVAVFYEGHVIIPCAYQGLLLQR